MWLPECRTEMMAAEHLSEKWDLREPVFAPWERLLPRDVKLRDECIDYEVRCDEEAA